MNKEEGKRKGRKINPLLAPELKLKKVKEGEKRLMGRIFYSFFKVCSPPIWRGKSYTSSLFSSFIFPSLSLSSQLGSTP